PGATFSSSTSGYRGWGRAWSSVVSSSDREGSAQASSHATAIVTGPPQSTGAPSISGTASQGQTLTASNGTWSGYPAPTFAYQWRSEERRVGKESTIPGAPS